MYIAYNNNGEVCNAIEDDNLKGGEYSCPLCKSKVIYKKGRKIQSHFAHSKNDNCKITTYKKESKEHLEVKKILYQHFKDKYNEVQVEYIFRINDSLQIADVYLVDKNIAFEYQRSVIPYESIKQRTLGYEKAAITLVWLIDVNKFVKELRKNNDIVYIRYAPFVDNFLNYHKGCIFFYGYDYENNSIVFYQLWSYNLKKRNAICKKTTCKLSDFDFPFSFKFSREDLLAKIYQQDVENYIYVQLKYDKTVKNKLLGMFYNQRIELTNIPRVLGTNFNEQLLFHTPLLIWQLEMYRLYNLGKSYGEIFCKLGNYIKFNSSIYINNRTKSQALERVIKEYYKVLSTT